MIRRAYCRCNSGHYFTGEYCPFDGWSSPASTELAKAVRTFTESDRTLSLEELRKAGVSAATLGRTIIIEFGSGASAFDAISPLESVVDGQAQPVRKLGRSFK
jgi:hypothetical protein